MQWGLANPWFLAGLAALAVPVLVHLVARAEQRGRGFPSLMFLRRIPFKARRRRTLRDRVLLLARCLALALAAVAFAGPYLALEPANALPATAGADETVLLLDRSWSMRHGERWARALGEVRARIGALGTGARAALITFDTAPRTVQEMTGERALLRAALTDLGAGAGGTELARALAHAARGFSDSAVRRRLVLISDLQRSAIERHAELPLAAGIELAVVGVGDTPALNPVVLDAVLGQADEESARAPLSVRVRNYGASPLAGAALSLALDGHALASQPLALAAGAERAFQFEVVAPSDRAVRTTLDLTSAQGEVLERYHLVLARPAPVTVVLVVADTGPGSGDLFLRHALRLAREPEIELQRISANALGAAQLRDADVLIVHDVALTRDASAGAIRQFVAGGGGLLVMAGAAPVTAGALAAADVLPGRLGAVVRDATRIAELGGHPALAGLAPETLAPASIWRYRQVQPGSTAEVLARFADGAPALLQRRVGAGYSLLLTTPPGGDWNDLALQPGFAPLAIELVRHLAARQRGGAALGSVAERPVDLRAYLERLPRSRDWRAHLARDGDLAVTTPDGDSFRFGPGGAFLTPAEPGFYRLHRVAATPGAPLDLAVNADAVERALAVSDADAVTARLHRLASGPAPATAGRPAQPDRGHRLDAWWHLLAAVAVLFLVEGLLAAYLSGRGRRAPYRGTQEAT